MRLLDTYDKHHRHPVNRTLHLISIPLSSLAFVVMWSHWIIGLSLVLGGLGLGILGHRIEGNRPAFFAEPMQVFIPPIWWVRTILGVGRKDRKAPLGN